MGVKSVLAFSRSRVLAFFVRAFLLPRAALAADILALRQQFAVLWVLAKRPAVAKARLGILALAVPVLGRLAFLPRDREARDGRALACSTRSWKSTPWITSRSRIRKRGGSS